MHGCTSNTFLAINCTSSLDFFMYQFATFFRIALERVALPRGRGQVDLFGDDGKAASTLRSDLMTAIPSRCAVHPALPLLAAATASGRIHVFR